MKDAYFSLAIRQDDKKYLKFWWRGHLYCFTCVVFGLSTAPRVFTKVMKVIFSHIRKFGVSSFFYIDDSLLIDSDYLKCLENTHQLRDLFESLGFVINKEKSCLLPSHRVVFLGFIIDSVQFKVYLPEDKIEKIIEHSKKMLDKKLVTVRQVSTLIGLYSSARCAILLAPLFLRNLDIEKSEALKECNFDYDKVITLSDLAKQEILWWIDNIRLVNGKSIDYGNPSIFLETDASSLNGWGAVLRISDTHSVSTQGRWTCEELNFHINVLELLAVKYALLALCQEIRNCHLSIKSDSATVVHYLNSLGGSVKTLFLFTKEIWLWAAERNVFISAVHVCGKDNIEPDNLSRVFSDSSEWKLHEDVFKKVCRHFFMPEIDLFATRLNSQLKNFISWFPDPEAIASDAFSVSWKCYKPYIFPPFSVVPQVLRKIEEDEVSMALLIVPMWHTQPWFPRLLNLLVDYPVRLPFRKDLLRLAHNGEMHTMNKRKLFLVACHVSGNLSKTKVFQSSLENFCSDHGDPPHLSNTNFSGENGLFGVVNAKLIRFRQLSHN